MGDVVSGLSLELTGAADTDTEELERLAGQLRRELLELDVEDVRQARSGAGADVPEGAKTGELVAAGALVVTVTPLLVRQLLTLVDTWVRHRPVRSVRVESEGRVIELGSASAEEQRRLIDAFLSAGDQTAGAARSGE